MKKKELEAELAAANAKLAEAQAMAVKLFREDDYSSHRDLLAIFDNENEDLLNKILDERYR